MNKYKIILEHDQNPDIGISGYWEEPKDEPRKVIEFIGLSEAPKIFRGWIQYNGLGGGNLTRESGMVYSLESGEAVAQVSFNGRLWTPEGWGKNRALSQEEINA